MTTNTGGARATPRCEQVHPSGERCRLAEGHDGKHQLDPLRHRCHARECTTPVKSEMLMCKRHWFMVPLAIRRRVWAAYRPGQCDDKRPSETWHEAADAAIKAVAEREARA